MGDEAKQGLATRAIHAGQRPDPTTGAIMPPIYQTSTYVQPELGRNLGYEYARTEHPTREALEGNIAALEGGAHGIAFASGLAALEGLVKTFSAGDHIVSEENLYGGTIRMFEHVLSRLGLQFTYVDSRDPANVKEALRPETRMVLLETPTNPMMRLADIAAVADVVREAGARLVVDNTFATPVNQRPLEMGADAVVHSTTKYMNGHSDVVGGAVVLDDEEWAQEIRFVRKSTGAVPGPMDVWLCLRGTKTLPARMAAHNANGRAMAEHLRGQPGVRQVHYPGLEDHPQHELARRQMDGFTGMVSVEMESAEAARTLVERTELFALAESLGGVESLISVPALMTHASVPREKREAMGVTDRLVRLSVGIEDADDLRADLDRGLAGR